VKSLASLQTFQSVLVDSGKVKPTSTRRHSAEGAMPGGKLSCRDTRGFCGRMRSNRSGCHLERRHWYPEGPPDSDARTCRVGTFAAPQRVFDCVSARPLIPACDRKKHVPHRPIVDMGATLAGFEASPRETSVWPKSREMSRMRAGPSGSGRAVWRRRAATADWCCGTPVICLKAKKCRRLRLCAPRLPG
jgi:hypothetical protein